jgi:hypothetical protein
MKTYKRVYPRGLKFIQIPSGIRVEYPSAIIKKRSPDIWALKYLLDKELYNFKGKNTITLGKTDPTMALRLHFMPKIFSGATFATKDDFKSQAKEIICNVTKQYKTYERDFKKRGTKPYPESLLETNIWNTLGRCFGNEFLKSSYGVRQFPANIFKGQVKEETRVTRKFWIDILTVNAANQLSVIELKAGGNASLDLLAQAIDYGIFCHLFKEHIEKCWFPDTDKLSKNKVAIYCIAEKFHPALIDDEGIKALIRPNEIMDIIFIQVGIKNDKVERYRVLFDTRNL